MKYLITMKNGTRYTDEQHRGFIQEMGYMMTEGHCHELADGRAVISCSEVASVTKLDSGESEAAA